MKIFTALIVVLLALALSGCGTLLPEQADRETNISFYLNQPERLVLYEASRLQVDPQLKVLGRESLAEPVVRRFQSTDATKDLVERFIALSPALSGPSTRLLSSEQWNTLTQNPSIPVLYIYVSWQLNYQRLPPKLSHYRLLAGVVAKVIPLGQVLSGKGATALRTASWEGKCYVEAHKGEFLPVDEWLVNDAARLKQAVRTIQETCGRELAEEFVH